MRVMDDEGLQSIPVSMELRACDGPRCGAHAYVFAEVRGTEIAYCGHHGTEYLPELSKVAIVIVDLRDTLGSKS